MSMHKIPLTPLERGGLEKHGLTIGTPSQISDAFRQGVAHALSSINHHNLESQPECEWVGLTDVDKEYLMEWLGHNVSEQVFYAIESKLREKNRSK